MKVNCQPSCKTTEYMLLTSKNMCENLFKHVMGFMFTKTYVKFDSYIYEYYI